MKQQQASEKNQMIQQKASQTSAKSKVSVGAHENPYLQTQGIIGNHGVLRHAPLVIQTKLSGSKPGDKYEVEADRIAEQVIRIPESKVDQAPKDIEKENESGERQLLKIPPKYSIINFVDTAHPFPTATLDYYESRFGIDFREVRIHTGSHADMISQALQAKAFSTGQDIFFQRGVYNPYSMHGRRIIAHELTHVVQQRLGGKEQKLFGINQDSRNQNSPVSVLQSASTGVYRWASLGYWRWPHPLHQDQIQEVTISAGTTSEWESVLRSMDSEREFRDHIEGFLLAALNETPRGAPGGAVIGLLSGPRGSTAMMGGPHLGQVITRPSDDQIRSFLRALYRLRRELDLPDIFFIETTPSLNAYYMPLLHRFVGRYQHLIISEMSEVWRGGTMETEQIRAVASQGGAGMRLQMMQNALAVALVAVRNRSIVSTEVARQHALNQIINAARIVRVCVEVTRANEQDRDRAISMADVILDVMWALVPGGGVVRAVWTTVGKMIVQACVHELIREAFADENLDARLVNMIETYQVYLNRLVSEHFISSNEMAIAYNAFRSGVNQITSG